MKTSELEAEDGTLDWAVAKCCHYPEIKWSALWKQWLYSSAANAAVSITWAPSKDWAQGGPIIEREEIQLSVEAVGVWGAFIEGGTKDFLYHGSTPLVAAMRCYVASKLGDEVEIPEELK